MDESGRRGRGSTTISGNKWQVASVLGELHRAAHDYGLELEDKTLSESFFGKTVRLVWRGEARRVQNFADAIKKLEGEF